MRYQKKAPVQDRTKRSHFSVDVLRERCKGCGFCIEFCPQKVLHESAEFNTKGYHPAYADIENDCTNCGMCELICPEFGISVVPLEKEEVHGR